MLAWCRLTTAAGLRRLSVLRAARHVLIIRWHMFYDCYSLPFFFRAMHFSAKRGIAIVILYVCPSGCLL